MMKIAAKIILLLVLAGLFSFGISYLYDCYVTPLTLQVSVKQFDNSTEAFTNLRNIENAKNWIANIIAPTTIVVWVLVAIYLFQNDVRNIFRLISKKSSKRNL